MYGVTFYNSKELFILCCLPSFEKNLVQLNLKKREAFLIGRDAKNPISYRNKMTAKVHAKIYLYENNWMLENYDKILEHLLMEKQYLKKQEKCYLMVM